VRKSGECEKRAEKLNKGQDKGFQNQLVSPHEKGKKKNKKRSQAAKATKWKLARVGP